MVLLDNGTQAQSWPTTIRHMCSKAAWFRARNSVDRSVAASPPQASASVCRTLVVVMRSSTVIRNWWMQGVEKRQCLTSTALSRAHLRRAWWEVCQWIACLAGGSSSGELRARSYGIHGIEHSLDLKQRKNGARSDVRARSSIHIRFCPSVRSFSWMMIDVRAYEGASRSAVPCTSGLADRYVFASIHF